MQSLAHLIRTRTCPGCGRLAHVLVVSDPSATAWCVRCIDAEVRYLEEGPCDGEVFVDSYFIFTVQIAGVVRSRRLVSYPDDRFFRYLQALLLEYDM